MARQGVLRGAWQQKRHGADIDRLERLTKALEALDRAGELTVKYEASLCDHKLVEQAEELEARVASALKMLTRDRPPHAPRSTLPGAATTATVSPETGFIRGMSVSICF